MHLLHAALTHLPCFLSGYVALKVKEHCPPQKWVEHFGEIGYETAHPEESLVISSGGIPF